MVDKADCLQLDNGRQAGADDLKKYFPELDVPSGLTFVDLEAAEQMVFDWEDGGDHRAFALVLRIFEHLEAARHAALKGQYQSS